MQSVSILNVYIFNCFPIFLDKVLGMPTNTKVFHSPPHISLQTSGLLYCTVYSAHGLVRFLLFSLKDEL